MKNGDDNEMEMMLRFSKKIQEKLEKNHKKLVFKKHVFKAIALLVKEIQFFCTILI